MGRRIRYLSIFSGVEAASLAWERLGWEPMAFAEVDEFPAAVLACKWPDVPNLGDVTKVDWGEFVERSGRPDVLIGGSPCFPAGTLVLCEDGFRPIEDVRVGDMVVTHRGRLRRVLRTGGQLGDTVILKGQGSVGIECTPNHPFYSRAKTKVWDGERRAYSMVADEEGEWTHAEDMEGRFWLNVCNVEDIGIPMFPPSGRGERGKGYIESFEFDEGFFYFVGRWLGDGWANEHRRKGREDSVMKRVYLCCSHEVADDLEERLSRTGLHFSRGRERTTERFTCASTQLYDWLVGNFGVHAEGKNVPAWCMGMPRELRAAMLQGYLDSDGCRLDNGYKASTVSRALSLGMKMLAGSVGMASSVTLVRNDRVATIEGRTVSERPYYVSTYYESTRSSFFADSGFYGKVREVAPGRSNVMVYNLEVEDDHSYTVDAVGCSNCQSFSVAGGRESLSGESRLMYEYIRAVKEVRPTWFVWENVPGCLNTRDNAFGQLLHEMEDIGYQDLAWRVLDAQFARVPVRDGDGGIVGWYGPVAQRRRRVFLVGHAGNGTRSAAVLFEPESLRGNHPSSREKREELASDARGGAQVGGGGLSAFKWYQGSAAGTMPSYEDGTTPTLVNADAHVPAIARHVATMPANAVGAPNSGTNGQMALDPDRPTPTLRADHHVPAVAIDYKQTPKTGDDLCHTLTHEGSGGIHSAIAIQTGHTTSNGDGVNTEGVSYTLSSSNDQAVAFAQNTREEVRLIGGSGDHVGTIAGTPDSKGQGGSLICQPMVMASAHANAEVGTDGVAPSVMAHAAKQPPIVIEQTPPGSRPTEMTSSPRSARATGTRRSLTTRASWRESSSLTSDEPG